MKKLGQFLIGFAIAFSPAPFVGMGAYAYVQGQEPSPQVTATPMPKVYGGPLDYRSSGSHPVMFNSGGHYQLNVPASAEPQSGGKMEIETDCARRKRVKQEKEAEKKAEKPPVPEL